MMALASFRTSQEEAPGHQRGMSTQYLKLSQKELKKQAAPRSSPWQGGRKGNVSVQLPPIMSHWFGFITGSKGPNTSGFLTQSLAAIQEARPHILQCGISPKIIRGEIWHLIGLSTCGPKAILAQSCTYELQPALRAWQVASKGSSQVLGKGRVRRSQQGRESDEMLKAGIQYRIFQEIKLCLIVLIFSAITIHNFCLVHSFNVYVMSSYHDPSPVCVRFQENNKTIPILTEIQIYSRKQVIR